MTEGKRTPWVVGVSGASGTPYAAAVIRGLLAAGESVDLVVSRASRLTLLDETGIAFRDAHWRDDLAEWLERGPTASPRPSHGRNWTESVTGVPEIWRPDRAAARTPSRGC